MIRAMVWKELREQGIIAATLMVLGGGILVAAAALAEPPNPTAPPTDIIRYLGVGRLATLLLAVTAGMVCGGALFAAEREAGTLGFLEALPASRARLWSAKLVAGLLLALTQIVVVVLISVGLGLIRTPGSGLAVMIYSLQAFAWGLLGSTLARTTLGSVGFAIPAATLGAFVILVPIMLLFGQPGSGWPRSEWLVLFLVLMLVTPIALSGFVFTRPDRERAADESVGSEYAVITPDPVRRGRPWLGIRALFWLTLRQLQATFLVTSAFALGFGFLLLAPTVQPFVVWPALALAAGVIAGVTTFADEQGHRSAAFWGERRLPMGRLWLVKVVTHAGFALWLAVLLMLPAAVRASGEATPTFGRGPSFLSGVMRSLLFDAYELGWQGWKYVLVPLAYGFAAGHLCGLVFRKAVVAAGVAGLVGGTAAALWVPSMMAGGLLHTQVWLPPAAALGAARLVIRPWAADRLANRGPVTALAGGLAGVFLLLAAGIGYRVVEVPNNPAGEDDLAYVETLPAFDANEAGRNFRAAAERYARFSATVSSKNDPQTATPRPSRPEDRLIDPVIHNSGWPDRRGPKADPELDAWVDALYTDFSAGAGDVAWFALAEESAARPVGMFEDPRNYSPTAGTTPLENARRMAVAQLGRGLQRQARDGDHAAFPDQFRTVLALVHNLRNGSIVSAAQAGFGIERVAHLAAYQWLRNLPAETAPEGRAVVARSLEEMIRANAEADPHAPYDPTPHLLAERYVKRTLMAVPAQWLPDLITPPGQPKEGANTEADLVSFAWTVPWERERTRRLVGMVYDPNFSGARTPLIRGRPGAGYLVVRGVTPLDLTENDRALRVFRRALVVALAARLYQLTRGEFPTDAQQLVTAACLPAIPPDPYDGQPFRYRRSAGEDYAPPVRPPGGPQVRQLDPPTKPIDPPVAAGQPIVWSVGPDRTDNGGRQPTPLPGNNPRQDDWVLVVPLPAVTPRR